MAEKHIRPEHLRVTHADRQATVERLGAAMTAGCLTLAEFEERVGAAWEAATRASLDILTADLPHNLPAPVSRRRRDAAERMLPVLRRASATWLVFCTIALALWGVACLVNGVAAVPWFLLAVAMGGATLAPLWHVADSWRR